MKYTKHIISICIILLTATTVYSYVLSNHHFETSTYKFENDKIKEPLRIIHISDVHNHEYGPRNSKLLFAVRNLTPDLIFVTGDSVNHDEEDIASAVSLVENLVAIAPVYFSYGNHERMNEERFGHEIGALMQAAGAIVLDYEYEDIEIKGQKLRIGGIYGYCLPEKYLKTGEADPEECTFLKEFQNTERFTMLLAHMPYGWQNTDGLNEWDINLVFAGHSHGGQIIMPLLGPVYAPDQGIFPGDIYGQFVSDDGQKQLIVSRGLGNSVNIPRFNNEPELVVVDLTGIE